MGFGKKTDFSTGKTLDLDKTYKHIIQPAVKSSGYECVRADEIQDSGLIDKSMYALLMRAELVVADISTYNPNAIYELGIRHGVRPFSTIIIKEEDGKIPFDLDHNRIFHYKHLGEDIGADEAKRCKIELEELIASVTKNANIDSPLYDYIKDVKPPKLSDSEYKRIIGDLAKREKHIFAIVERARELMLEDDFLGARGLWERASEIVPTEVYFIQQLALSTYKSKHPSEMTSLTDALSIIEKLAPDGETNDPETLGLTGAIYKRMWQINKDVEFLKRAINYYRKGFQIRNDYYTGENYALCLDMISSVETDKDEKTYYRISAQKARKEIITSLKDVESLVEESEINGKYKWQLATLSQCYYGTGDERKGAMYEGMFMTFCEANWEKETFEQAKKTLFKLVRG